MNTQRPLRVLYIGAHAHLYGDNRSLICTLRGLKSSFNIEMLVCTTQKGLFTDELTRNGIRWELISGTMAPRILPINLSCKWLHRLYGLPLQLVDYYTTHHELTRIIKAFEPDLIHTNNSFIYAGIIMARHFHVPHVWHIREYIDLDHHQVVPNTKFFDKGRKDSHCIAITKGVFEHWNLSAPKDVQIYNGVFTTEEVPPYHYEKKPYFLFLGRVQPTKGVEDMLNAFSLFARHNSTHQLYIVGSGQGSYIQQLRQLVNKYELIDRVQFVPFQKDVRPLLQEATALIVPSPFEAMGRITAEAMLTGCFVIGRATAGTLELLEADHVGLHFDTNEQLASQMEEVAQYSPEQLMELNQKALTTALGKYTAEANASQIWQYYQTIIHP